MIARQLGCYIFVAGGKENASILTFREEAREMSSISRYTDKEINQAVIKMLDCGVEHGDVRPPSVCTKVWNPKSREGDAGKFSR